MALDAPDPSAPVRWPGRATTAGTRRFADRMDVHPDHFSRPDELWLSSIALGTLRGDPGGVDDLLYRGAIADYLELGGNVLDTALSDRMQTSERALGRALGRALREGQVARDEVVVVTKGGALTPDPERARDYTSAQRDLYTTYLDSGLLDPAEVIQGHALAPRFLLDQIRRSRRNLGLETIDYYLIQEPEIALRKLGPDGFADAMRDAFEALEHAVERGWIAAYGVASWDGLLLPDSERSHLSIVELFEAALDVGSADHHFRALQLPYGLAMGEGAVLDSQLGPDGHSRAILESLERTGTAVLASAPLYGGRLVGHVPDFVRRAFPEAPSDAMAALQFVRSTANVSCAVVGMREAIHVEENMRLARIPRADAALPRQLFARALASRHARG
ncbi:MAG: aldo/keto reductase [Deltaproteobacteria bacterium]|jgi:aryl-alcohol dehydrogenase-like predicted oxidoreductase|nr:aldo/keto reductase [Deltaproteobacteria bacterium]MBW2499197.1 aldo/keto reductase [Deltaproteobacteria bacterium]